MTIELMKDRVIKYNEEKYFFSKFDLESNTLKYRQTSVKEGSDIKETVLKIDDIDYFFIYRSSVIQQYKRRYRPSETGAAAGTNLQAIYINLYRFSIFINKVEYILDEVIEKDLELLRERTSELIKAVKKRTYYKFDKAVFVDQTKNIVKNDPHYTHNLLFKYEEAISYREYDEIDMPYYQIIKKRNEIPSFTDTSEIQVKSGQTTVISFKRDYYSSKSGEKSIRIKIYNVLTWILSLSLGYMSTRMIHIDDFVATIAIAFGVTALSYLIIYIAFIQTRLARVKIDARIIIDDYSIRYQERDGSEVDESMDINSVLDIVKVDDTSINFFLKERVFSILFYGTLGSRLIPAIRYAIYVHFK